MQHAQQTLIVFLQGEKNAGTPLPCERRSENVGEVKSEPSARAKSSEKCRTKDPNLNNGQLIRGYSQVLAWIQSARAK